MSEEMFCFQCQEACGNTGCTVRGVCGKTAETAINTENIFFITKTKVAIDPQKIKNKTKQTAKESR